jgi:hypothetical protein
MSGTSLLWRSIATNRVSVARILIVFGPHALLRLAEERPKFVALHVSHFDVGDFLGHDAVALLSSEHEQFQDGRVMDFVV